MKVVKMFFFLLAFPFTSQGQSVEVTKETLQMDGKNSSGYQVGIAAAEDEVRSSLSKYLKDIGKARQSGDYITIAEPLIGGKKYATTLFATTRQTDKGTAAWIGMVSESGI